MADRNLLMCMVLESMSGLETSRQFWDEKARENPYWYVSSAGPSTEGRNLAEFWASGPKIWNDLKSATGYQSRGHVDHGRGNRLRRRAPELARSRPRWAGYSHFDLSAEMLESARSSVEAGNVSFHRAETPALAEIADGWATRSSHTASFSICPILVCCGNI